MNMTTLILFGSFALFLVLGLPVSISLGLSSLVSFFYCGIPIVTIAQRLYTGMDSFPLMAIPLFILAGNLMTAGGISRKIVDFANILTGRVRRQSAPQGNRLTAMAAIPTALALAALFLAFPQESYVNRSEATRDAILSWFQSIPEKVENVRQEVTVSSQEPDHVRLASLGRRIESPVTVMEVTAEIGHPLPPGSGL